jgi:isochorismate synthase
LLASSELNDEWQETEKKLQTMRRILVSAPIMMNH